MKNKKKKYVIAGIIVAMVVLVAILLSSSYAYWQLTRKQTSPNDVVALCLDLSIENETGTFGLSKAWPISDEEGKTLEGLTFEVKNNCDKPINYIVGLNSIETEANTNYMSYDSIKVMIDDHTPLLYGDLGKVQYANAEDTAVIRDSRQLSLETIEGGVTNTHNVKAWVDMDSDVSNQGKTFSGKVFITGGQGIVSSDNCFTIAQDGTIWGYNEDCGLNVTVPAEINGIQVKTINRASFNEGILVVQKLYGEYNRERYDYGYQYNDAYIILRDENQRSEITDELISELNSNAEVVIFDNLEEYYDYDFSKYESEFIDVAWILNTGVFSAYSNIITLDLSEAVYLEEIKEDSLYGRRSNYKNYGLCDGLEIMPDGSGSGLGYCKSPLKKVILPENGMLATIEQDAFGSNNLTEINLPNTLKYLSGFDGNDLVAIDIPTSVEEIGNIAFSDNPIQEIFIPSNVKKIGASAFYGSSNSKKYLSTLTFEDTEEKPSQLEVIGYQAFGFGNLVEVTIPNSVTEIAYRAFINNELTKIAITDTETKPSQLKTIGDYAFSMNNLEKMVIPASVSSIGTNVFDDNLTLNEIIIKRTEADATANVTFADYWNYIGRDSNTQESLYALVTYNPDYTE